MVHRLVVFVSRTSLVADCDTIRSGSKSDADDRSSTRRVEPHPGLPPAVLLHTCTLLVDEKVGDGVYPLPLDWRLEVRGERIRMIWGDELEGGPSESASQLTLPESYRRVRKRPPEAMPS